MPQFLQQPQQKYRPQGNASQQNSKQQQPGCSQFMFLLALLLLMNMLMFKACAPEKPAEETANGSLDQALQAISAPEKLESAEKTASVPDAAPAADAAAPDTAENTVPAAETGSAIETVPTEVSNPDAAPENAGTPENAETPENAAPTASVTENAANEPETRYLTLGSADPASPYRMLVTFTSRGAAVARVELNERRLASMSDEKDFKGGYLGALSLDSDPETTGGCVVEVVGDGTPAQSAGLKVGDRITKVNDADVQNAQELTLKIQTFKPGKPVSLTVVRDGAEQKIEAKLGREPVSVIRPERETEQPQNLEAVLADSEITRENNLSFLTTLYAFGDQSLSKLYMEMKDQIKKDDFARLNSVLNKELFGFNMHGANWEVTAHTQDSVTFCYRMPVYGLEIQKTYTLVRADEAQKKDEASRTYHLTLGIRVKNVGNVERKIAIQQDGPTGLLTEGYWFCSKAGRGWGTPGIRDVLIGYEGNDTPNVYTCSTIAGGKWGNHVQCSKTPLNYIGVDAQYFSSILIPDAKNSSLSVEGFSVMRVGNVPKQWTTKTNTSCRVISPEKTLKPGEEAGQQFTIFVGPKRPKLLSQYSLDNVVYYGWFSWIASILVAILHFFYGLIGNYGVAILLLTVLVRVLMFPLSKKQILSTIVMQKMQPEIKRINEKFTDPMERQKAQMLLFKKYKYNPMSGCWVMLIQLPIFIALYRALLVDVELRQASLFGETIRFCSNLVAPDMFFCWKDYVWTAISGGYGMFGLGPYLNILPVLTIIIFIVQQKVMMPPALDEQAKMQQNMMKYMMIFMGLLFFKVPCGLCLYFIVSSLWGLLERRFMPSADNYQLSENGVIDMRVQNGTAVSSQTAAVKKEGFFARLGKKIEAVREAVEARDAEIERRANQEKKNRKRNKK